MLGVFQFAERFFFLRFKFRDARGFLKNHPAIFRLAGKNLRDVALRHDAVARAPDARAHEQLLDVLQPARSFVDEIFAAAIAENPARDGHFVVGNLDARRRQMFLIHPADGQRNFGHAQRLAAIGAVENHVRHFAAAQGLGGLFAQHPANGVRDIGLAAAVGADDGRDAGLKIQAVLSAKDLKPKTVKFLRYMIFY